MEHGHAGRRTSAPVGAGGARRPHGSASRTGWFRRRFRRFTLQGLRGLRGAGPGASGSNYPLPPRALDHAGWADGDCAIAGWCQRPLRAGAAPLRAGAIPPGSGHGARGWWHSSGDRGQNFEAASDAAIAWRPGGLPHRSA